MEENSPPAAPKITVRPLRRTVKLVNPGFVPPTAADAAQDRLKAVPQTFDGKLISQEPAAATATVPVSAKRTLTIKRTIAAPTAEPAVAAPSRKLTITRKPPMPVELAAYKKQEAAEEGRDPYVLKEDTLTAFASPTRRGFGRFIYQTFQPFTLPPKIGEPDPDACKKLMEAGQSERVETFLYQQFIREYLRAQTPYRGLLVYHGLGSGKTCSAIAAAEALFGTAHKKIIVMTPFSLRGNFQAQISFCGFKHYRLNNYWTFLDLADETIALYSAQVLHISDEFINSIRRRPEKARRGVWVPDFDKPSNYKDLSPQQQSDIRSQLTAIIENRITFINYNGITPNKLKALACDKPDFFDDAVIIIDEIHNITRLMQGNLEKYMRPRKSRKGPAEIPPEPVEVDRWSPFLCGTSLNYNRAFFLYKLLVGARNSKIIGLSGTPLINFPDELGILMNIVAGYIHCCSATLATIKDSDLATIRAICAKHPRIDMIRLTIGQARTELFFSIFQEGYTKNADNTGLVVDDDEAAQKSVKAVWDDLAAESPLIAAARPVYTAQPRFPVEEETFQNIFLNRATLAVKNENILMKRMHGLVSYYKGSSEDLMPKIVEDLVVRVPFSPYALGVYITKRKEEIEVEKKQEQREKKRGKQEAAGPFDEVKKVSSTANYRFNSRAACNFAFPSSINRPSLSDTRKAASEMEDAKMSDVAPITEAEYSQEAAQADADAAEEVAAEEAAIAAEEMAAEAVQVGSGPSSDDDDDSNSNVSSIVSSEYESSVEDSIASSNASSEYETSNEESAANSNEESIISSEYESSEEVPEYTEAELAELPEDIRELYLSTKKEDVALESVPKTKIKKPAPSLATGRVLTYEEELALALQTLRSRAKQYLQLDGPEDSNLQKFSPKFAEVLRRVNDTPGSSLLYSQFKTVEGLGIFGYALEANGWARIEIRGSEFTPDTIESLKTPGQNRFLFFTGEGTLEERKILLNIFNARINELPPKMQKVMNEAGFVQGTGNINGEICRLIGITGAGAEGISLKCVRAVHILEPYWNNVRTDQVKGRAVRICSHADLPPEERTVSVFTYCSVFDKGDIQARRVDQTILLRDEGITSDERVQAISEKKGKINEDFLRILKQSAVDCVLNSGENEPLSCYQGMQGSATEPAFDPDLNVDLAKSVLEETAGTVGIGAAPAQPLRMTATVAGPVKTGFTAPVTLQAVAPALPAAQSKASTVKRAATTIAGKQYWMDRKKGVEGEVYLLYDLIDRVGQNPRGEVEKNPITGKFKVSLFK